MFPTARAIAFALTNRANGCGEQEDEMKDGKLRLKACITIEFQTENFMEAGEHQRRLTQLLDQVRRQYPDCRLDLRELRTRAAAGAAGHPQQPATRTGRLRPYASVA
jgi:hypothetical protein